jgi:hypothetical protein
MISIIVKVSAVLLVSAIVQALIHRRASAAMRHFVWTLALASVLLLPVLSLTLPEWTLIRRTTSATETLAVAAKTGDARAAAVPDVTSRAQGHPISPAAPAMGDFSPPSDRRTSSVSWTTVAAAVYGAGLLAIVAGLVLQQSAVRRLGSTTDGGR